MGHYLVGRWSGIRVLAFSVGFGPELVGFTDKHGTRWKISAIPLGGYVRFYGDADAASLPDGEELAETDAGASAPRPLPAPSCGSVRSPWPQVRSPISSLAIVIFAVHVRDVGQAGRRSRRRRGRSRTAPPASAGIKPGDVLVALDGTAHRDLRRRACAMSACARSCR